MNILIVDDNPGIRRMLKRAVDPIATEISVCEDGADALATYTQNPPDLVLMDIKMPRMDGLEATRRILQVYPSARIVIVTDYDDDELRRAAIEAGAVGYCLKQNLTDLPMVLMAAREPR